ncbi:hypothetical protein FJT64_008192 [Amphibalanus amphitrite]|uniref:Uncharacterized protein n=1 Tax=Amphibalanus amphitrite TaxID=1232801 RepID=A0A6A4VTP0_AMPAM|nr:hypothetical protein FJT64_008192 [Amphibalanus amphitrite]
MDRVDPWEQRLRHLGRDLSRLPPGASEGVESVVSCGHDPVRLRCRSYHQMATVLEAWFYETAHVCVERPPPPPQPPSTADTAVPRYSVLASFNAK